MRPSRVGTTPCANTPHRHAHKNEKKPLPYTGRPAATLHRDEMRQAEKAGDARERERERDASATLTRPITDTSLAHGPSTALFPKENTPNTQPSLSNDRGFPLPESPSKALEPSHKDRPKPSLMSHNHPNPSDQGLSVYTPPRQSCQVPSRRSHNKNPEHRCRRPIQRSV